MPANLLRNLPSVTEILESPQLKAVRERVGHNVVVGKVRAYLEDLRQQVQTTATEVVLPTVSDLAHRLAQRILQTEQSRLRPVVNATGVLLHPALQGPPLALAAIDDMLAVAGNYASLNHETSAGETTAAGAADLLQELSGAEATLVVHSPAAATVLALAALAGGREVILARSQLVQRRDGFRLVEGIEASGARLHEVGAVNSCRGEDYQQAINANTSALLLVEVTQGASTQPPVSLAELSSLAHRQQLCLIHDQSSSGMLLDMGQWGGPLQPTLAASLRQGADLVIASGDCLGGPACGLLLGKRAQIEQISRHALWRAMQADHCSQAALAATLRLYRQPELARDAIPLLQLWTTSVDNLQNRAMRLAPQLAACACVSAAVAREVAGHPGGACETVSLRSWCVDLRPATGWTSQRLVQALQSGHPAVMARVEGESLVVDLRAVFARQDQEIAMALSAIAKETKQ